MSVAGETVDDVGRIDGPEGEVDGVGTDGEACGVEVVALDVESVRGRQRGVEAARRTLARAQPES